MSFFNEVWDGLQGGFLRKPLKNMTGMSDAQLAGAAALAVAAPYALPSMGASGAAGAGQAAGAASAGSAGAAGGSSMSGGLFSFAGGQPAAPIVDLSTKASTQAASSIPAQGGGMLESFSEYAGPASNVANIAEKAGAFGGNKPQYPQPQFQQGQGFGGLLTQVDQFDPEKRRKDQQMAMQGLLGGYRG